MLEQEYWRRAADMDVRVLRWPDQADESERLARLEAPRLLLVEPGVAAPTETSCVVDWLRLPTSGEDMRARLAALSERAARHPSRPFVDDYGQLSHRGLSVFLPRVDERIAKILIDSSSPPVWADALIRCVWTKDGSRAALRAHVFKLKQRIASLGLTITHVGRRGYVIREVEPTDTNADPPALSPSRLTADTT